MNQQLHVRGFSVSLDGYSAGPDQSLSNPLGTGGERLHEWMIATRTFSEREGLDGTGEGINDLFVRSHFDGIGATIMGRNMFGPVRGPWESSDAWNGWWGGNPPYHHPVFVLTNHPRDSVEMDGGTTFHFITGGIGEARDCALVAADGLDVLVGGGADTVRQYLRAGLIDRIHLVMVPVLLGSGERLLEDLARPDGRIPSYRPIDLTPSGSVVHIQLAKEEEGRPRSHEG
ncbi:MULTISPECIES: dihydrofolate reductase family protein [unclassified Arthrobacter]|uniref:dihydrofolate reductase family protein n=1 Tax=unclassified Arthrobacter TaxID=235627 RepID=UPI001E43E6B6|nr:MULTISPECIES: dihydrofolate reductase family protein [unclassified Arthrobacter]MCC9145005.1 dihydrofolate reductase family protein [Arthrobacter sp. zg-Y919]MDK1276233.1 dihydrofolate reductase family protein [Arthrobacter sp. zg.Y919]WIB02156.1 dihydrofolate reductase family protein [Arthrobacter sp. zg-Y919]